MAKRKTEILNIIKYSITGGAWFWSGYAMFALCYSVLGLSLFWAKLIANLFGLSVNFILERIWVFDDRKQRVKKLTVVTERYAAITVTNLFIDYFIVWGLREAFGLTPYIGQFFSAGFFWGWNYLWYRYWVFAQVRKTKKSTLNV